MNHQDGWHLPDLFDLLIPNPTGVLHHGPHSRVAGCGRERQESSQRVSVNPNRSCVAAVLPHKSEAIANGGEPRFKVLRHVGIQTKDRSRAVEIVGEIDRVTVFGETARYAA